MKVYCLFYVLDQYYDDNDKTLFNIYESKEEAERVKEKMSMHEMIIEEWSVLSMVSIPEHIVTYGHIYDLVQNKIDDVAKAARNMSESLCNGGNVEECNDILQKAIIELKNIQNMKCEMIIERKKLLVI